MNFLRLSILLLALLAGTAAQATDAQQVHASHAWIRVLPGDLPAGAYVALENDGDQPAALVGASSPTYASVMLHQSSSAGGMSRMTMIEQVPIPAHGKSVLAPAGYHLMLMKAAHPVKPGDVVKLMLKFRDGSTQAVDFTAQPANAVDDTAP